MHRPFVIGRPDWSAITSQHTDWQHTGLPHKGLQQRKDWQHMGLRHTGCKD